MRYCTALVVHICVAVSEIFLGRIGPFEGIHCYRTACATICADGCLCVCVA